MLQAAAQVPDRIRGFASLNASGDLHLAYAHLETLHSAPCEPPARILFARLGTAGVTNDINEAVRALALAAKQGRQLVLLPPERPARDRIRKVAGEVNVHRPWHWLPPELPLDLLLHPSACQRHLMRTNADALEAIGYDANGCMVRGDGKCLAEIANATGLAPLLPNFFRMHPTNNEVSLKHFPPRLWERGLWRNGMLWWFQVLTTFLVRVRGDLARRLDQKSALRPLSGSGIDDAAAVAPSAAVARYGFGWTPRVAFDLAVHVRQGDACGALHKEQLRRCLSSLQEALDVVHATHVADNTTSGPDVGTVSAFVASDSQAIIDEAANQARQLQHAPRMSWLPMGRGQYELKGRVEYSLFHHNTSHVVEETLLDVLHLSRGATIAGGMAGNVPRLALQLRVRPPGESRPYIALDAYHWCAKSSCKAKPWAKQPRAAASRGRMNAERRSASASSNVSNASWHSSTPLYAGVNSDGVN